MDFNSILADLLCFVNKSHTSSSYRYLPTLLIDIYIWIKTIRILLKSITNPCYTNS